LRFLVLGTGIIFYDNMNIQSLDLDQVVAAIEAAWFFGWAIGFGLWLVRYLLLELPRTGSIWKGGDILK
jgi:hypothetical protein